MTSEADIQRIIGRKPMSDDQEEEFNDFMSKVDEIDHVIQGLKDGTIDAATADKTQEKITKQSQEEVQRRILREKEREVNRKVAQEKREREEHRKKWGFYGKWCSRCKEEKPMEESTCSKCKETLLTADQRKEELMKKVQQLQEERKQRDIARDKWRRWKSSKKHIGMSSHYQDYFKWDYFEDSDEENEELPPPPPPDTPEFREMELDIERRAKSKREKRKQADEFKQKGNDALKAGDLQRAFEMYTLGIDKCKDHKALLTNHALVCLKLGKYKKAADSCTKVLDIAEIFDDNRGPGVREARIKALMRRAAARKNLSEHKGAFDDLKLASTLDKKSPEIKQLLEQQERDLNDWMTVQAMKKKVSADTQKESEPGCPDDGVEIDNSETKICEVAEEESTVDVQINDRIQEAFGVCDIVKPLLVPWTIKESPKPSKSGTEQNIQRDDKDLLEQISKSLTRLVTLCDDENVLLLVREKRVLHQCMACIACHGFSLPFLLPALKVSVMSVNHEGNAREAQEYRHGQFFSAMCDIALPRSKGSKADQSKSVQGSTIQALQFVETISQFAAPRAALVQELTEGNDERVQSLLLNAMVSGPVSARSQLGIAANLATEEKSREALLSTEPSAAAVLVPLLMVKENGINTVAAKCIMNMCASEKMRQSLCKVEFTEILQKMLEIELEAMEDTGDDSICDLLFSILANASLQGEFAAVASKAGLHKLAFKTLQEAEAGNIATGAEPLSVLHSLQFLSRVAKDSVVAAFLCSGDRLPVLFARFKTSKDTPCAEVAVRTVAIIGSINGQYLCNHSSSIAGGYESLISLVLHGGDNTAGNAALVLQQLSASVDLQEKLGGKGAIGSLIETIKKRRGPAQKNAAVALAKLAQHPANAPAMAAMHGTEVLHSYLRV